MSELSENISSQSLNPLFPSILHAISDKNQSPPQSHNNKLTFQLVERKMLEEPGNDDVDFDEDKNVAQNYFQQDPQQDQEQENEDEQSLRRRLNSKREINSYEVRFKPRVFFKFMIMHVLFFCVMGPLIILLTPIFGWRVLRNQGFIGFSWICLIQTIEYLIILSYLIVLYTSDIHGLQQGEVYMMIMNVFIRILTICCKYAYQTEIFLKLMHTTSLTATDKTSDLLITRWTHQTEQVMKEEIQAAILRLEIDSPLFFCQFIGKVAPELKSRLQVAHQNEERNREEDLLVSPKGEELSERSSKVISPRIDPKGKGPKIAQGSKTIFHLFSRHYKSLKLNAGCYSGYSLAFDMIKNSKAIRFRYLALVAFLVSLTRALIPTLYRLFLITKGVDIMLFTDRPYMVATIFIQNVFCFGLNIYTISLSTQDMKSKIWCFKQISHLISPKRLHYFEDTKLYPTLNIFDVVSLRMWSNLRKLVKDYGKKYILRNNLNVTVSVIFYIYILSLLVLQALQILSRYNDPFLIIIFGFECLVFFIMFVFMMVGAAFLNSQYKAHKNLLKKNKTIITDFLRLSRLYTGKDAIPPDNIVYKEGLRLLKKELGEEDFETKLVERAENLIAMIDDIIEELEFEEENEPFTVMGFPITYGLLKTLFAGVISLIFAVAQSFMK